ncbi:MAG: ABC transporter permease [Alkalispirochaetaceae bacterium]
MELFLVAAKNIRRNRRRSILNIAALAIGLAIMILALGWINGYDIYIYRALQDFETGHVQILREAYLPEQRRFPVDITVPRYAETREALANREDVVAASGRVNFTMNLSHGRNSARLLGRAIDPEHEAGVTIIEESLEEGDYLGSDNQGILISQSLAEKFEVGPGDTMFVTAMDKFGVDNLIDVPVAGIFSYGYPAIDDNIVFFDLATASDLLSMENEVTKIVLRFSEGSDLDAARAAIVEELSQFPASGEVELVAKSWRYFAQVAVSAVRQDVASFQILMGIIIFLIVIGILNSMSMSVHERIREIGTLRAIGMKRRQVTFMVSMESVALGLVAFVVGVIISAPAAIFLQQVGLDIGQYMPENIPVPFGELFFAEFTLGHYLWALFTGVATAALGAFVPARRAAKLEIADAMRTVR